MYRAVLDELESPHIIRGGFDLFQNLIIKRTVIISVVQQPGLDSRKHCTLLRSQPRNSHVSAQSCHSPVKRLQCFLIYTKFLGSGLEALFNVDERS